MKEIKIAKLNEEIENNASKFISDSDFKYEEQIDITAECISARRQTKPLVFVAGPRGSAKKITARKIRNALEKNGVKAFLITLDNYLLADADEDAYDFENPTRINIEAFNEDMRKIIDGKPIYVSAYSNQTSGYTLGGEIDFHKGDILIVEGLQTLNPEITDGYDDYASYVYASVRTRIVSGNLARLHPSKIRLLRRIVRATYNGKPIESILDVADETQIREDRYIMPYKYRANYEIDSFIGYEASAYKALILPKLLELEKTYPLNKKFGDLMKLLDEVSPLDTNLVPENSMIHEFMDGIK